MFILVPLVLMLVSAIGISFMFFRKIPYLNKLTPETHLSARTGTAVAILNDLFPELSEVFKNLRLKDYWNPWLVETEKLLRRLRVISLKMDRISDSWIKKIRRNNVSRITTQVVSEKTEVVENPT